MIATIKTSYLAKREMVILLGDLLVSSAKHVQICGQELFYLRRYPIH